MKYFLICILFLTSASLFARGKTDYIKISGFNTNSYELENIEDFISLVKEHKAKKIFYSDTHFVLQSTRAAYTFKRSGYNTIEDYKKGKKRGFKNGESYYFAKNHKLKTQKDVDAYRQ